MLFQIQHQTEYRYTRPASESVAELRICPQNDLHQTVKNRKLEIVPTVPVEEFIDGFGNRAEFLTIPFRHSRLVLRHLATVETHPASEQSRALALSLREATRNFREKELLFFFYLYQTPQLQQANWWPMLAYPQPDPEQSLHDWVWTINLWINHHFRYQPGVTEVSTPIGQIVEKKAGVCQDFAHLMLAILRREGVASRYVSGYIEATDPTKPGSQLTGAAASHAWVEVANPDGLWLGYDPTNKQVAGERHVKIAHGRHYQDVAPLRGTYKGAQDQKLRVMVSLKRKNRKKVS